MPERIGRRVVRLQRQIRRDPAAAAAARNTRNSQRAKQEVFQRKED